MADSTEELGAQSAPARPPAARALPVLGNALGLSLDPLSFQSRLHARLGPVFSARVFGRRLIFVDTARDASLADQFFRAPDDRLDVISAYRGLLGGLLGEDLFVPISTKLRAGLTPRYARRHLPGSVDAALPHFRARIEASPAVDLVRVCSDVVLRLLVDFLMGGELSLEEKADLCDAFERIENDYSVLGMLSPIPTPAFRRRIAARSAARALIRTAIERRLRRRDDPGDLLQHLLTSHGAETHAPPTREETEAICLQMVGMVFAGHTNTAMTLALCLTELAKRPDLRTEVRRQVGSETEATSRTHDPFDPPVAVHRVVSECVRLHSLGSCWRRAMQDQELGGFRIRAGEFVGASLGRINLDPARFDAPSVFDPTRSSPPRDRPPEVESAPSDLTAAAGFGVGRHRCPGRSLARSILGALLSSIAQEYHWTLEAEPAGWYRLMFPGVNRPIGSVRMRFEGIPTHQRADAPSREPTCEGEGARLQKSN